METSEALELCLESLQIAEDNPGRHDEYVGCIVTDLEGIRAKLLRGKLSPQDERAFTEIVLLTEKWVS